LLFLCEEYWLILNSCYDFNDINSIFMKRISILFLLIAAACGRTTEVTVTEGETGNRMFRGKEYTDFILTGEAFLEDNASASITFHSTGEAGPGTRCCSITVR